MPEVAERKLLLMLTIALALFSPLARAQMSGLVPTAVEIAQLPQFCWAQMGVPKASGPEFQPQQCGPGWNHYCPGLVLLLRAKRTADKGKFNRLIDASESDVQYTEEHIKSYPSCSIRAHVEITKAAVRQLRAERASSEAPKKMKK